MISEGNGRQDDAILGLKRELKETPDDFSTNLRLASAYFNAEMLNEASDIYQSLISKHPGSYPIILTEAQGRGLVEYRIGPRATSCAEAVHALRESAQGTEFQPRMMLPDGRVVKVGTTARQTAKQG